MENRLDEFLRVHDECLAAWGKAVATGDGAGVAGFTGETFHGTSAYAGMEKAGAYERAEAVAGLSQLLGYVRGGVHRAENRLARMRGDKEAVVFYERIFERESRVLLRLMVIQTWRLTDFGWRVVREAIEQLAA